MTTAYTLGHASTWRPNIGIGFEKALSDLETVFQGTKNNSYPPYNIFKAGENRHAVELAVAGFSEQDLDIEVAENTLTIVGNKETADDRDYSHKGISARKFERKFVLAEYVEVVESTLANGILTVVLQQIIPVDKQPKKIVINA